MAVTIRDLLVKLGVDAEGADAEVSKLDGALSDLKDVMVGVVAVATTVTAAIAAVAASAAAAGDAVDKGATAATISTTAYLELAFTAGQAGTTMDVVTKALSKQTTALTQLEAGTGTAADAMADLGLTYEDMAGLSTDEQFKLTAEAISNLGTEQEQLAAATAIYGEDMAQQLLPMLQLGAEGMDELATMAHDLGLVMSEEQVAAAVEFTDTWDQVWSMVTGIKNAIGLELLPTLTDLLVRVRDWYTANRELIATKLEAWLDIVVAGIESVIRMAEAADEVVVAVFGGWEPVLWAVAAAITAVGAAAAAMAALQVWGAIEAAIAAIGAIGAATFGQVIAVVGAVVAAVVLLYLAIDDLLTYLDGGDSALGRFLDTFRQSDGVLGAMARGLEVLISVGGKLWELIRVLGALWWDVFSRTTLPVIKLVGAALIWLAEQGLGLLGWYWDNVVSPAWAAFGAAIDWLLGKLESLQPAIDWLLGKLDTLLAAISAVTGVDVTVGGEVSDTGGTGLADSVLGSDTDVSSLFGPSSDQGADSSLFAPSSSEALGSLGSLGASGGLATTTTQQVTVAGNTYTITGTGWTEEDVLALIAQAEEERARATSAALEGTEV